MFTNIFYNKINYLYVNFSIKNKLLILVHLTLYGGLVSLKKQYGLSQDKFV